jgi:putative ABC transport system substrate-binding protein
VRSPDEFAQAFATMTRAQADALVVTPSGLFFSHRSQLAALAMQHRLPAMFLEREFVEAGGLIAYGPSMGLFAQPPKKGYSTGQRRPLLCGRLFNTS